MLKILLGKIKAIAKHIVVAFFFTCFVLFISYIVIGTEVEQKLSFINKVATFNEHHEVEYEIVMDHVQKKLIKQPFFGDVFGSVKIESVGIDTALYHGDTLDILKYGAGHLAGSYFPGEGGSIVISGHNAKSVFYNLPQVKDGDIVEVKTTYGTYKYKVTKTEIAYAKDLGDNLRIYDNKETVMLYTCYPVGVFGFKTQRFVVYADLIGGSNEK